MTRAQRDDNYEHGGPMMATFFTGFAAIILVITAIKDPGVLTVGLAVLCTAATGALAYRWRTRGWPANPVHRR